MSTNDGAALVMGSIAAASTNDGAALAKGSIGSLSQTACSAYERQGGAPDSLERRATLGCAG